MIILIGGEKGGTGKTTLTTNLAARLILEDKDVLIIDTDKQSSASAWSATRDEAAERDGNIKRVPTLQKFGRGLSKEILDLSKRYENIIVDAGGRDSIELRTAMTVADKLYIPIQASQFDVWTIGVMDEIVAQAKIINSKLEAFVLINRSSTNPLINETTEAKELLQELDNLILCDSLIRDRIAFRKAAKSGLSVYELPTPDSKATDEIEFLFNEIFYSSNLDIKKEVVNG